MKIKLKYIFLSLIPSLILGLGVYYLISLLNGMGKVENTSLIWLFIGSGMFIFQFVSKNNGQNIFGRFLRYAAYECWISPFCALIYTITSISQAKNSLGSAGAIGATIGGVFLIPIFIGVGGLLGLVLYLLSKSIMKNKNKHIQEPLEKTQEPKEKIIDASQWTCPALVVLILIFWIVHKSTEKTEIITNISNTTPQRGYVLNPKELQALNIIFKDEEESFAKGISSMLELLTASSKQIAKDYNENEVAADQKYFKKMIRLSGYIESINSGLGNEPYITLDGINSFLLPQAHFKNGNILKISKLHKRQKVCLVCKGNGAVISIPMFNNCQFAKDYAENEIMKIKLELEDFLHGKKTTSESIAVVAIFTIATVRALPETSACFSNKASKCLKEIREVTHTQNFIKIIKAVVTELKTLGIQTPERFNT